MRAGLYARVSREEQVEGYSIQAQLDAMRRFCKERDWTIVAEYVEPGFTARTDQRPVFLETMAACEHKELDVLVTHKLDRAFRSLLDQLNRLSQLASWGVTYVSVVEQLDYTTPHGRMFMAMLGALNQYFSDNLSQETKKGKRGRAQAGLTNASHPAYGYTRGPDGVDIIEPATAAIVKQVFEMYATGQYSTYSLARALGQTGDRRWHNRAVYWILTNPFYIGQVRHRGIIYDGAHEPLISQELWQAVQDMLRHKSKYRPRLSWRAAYMLQGIVFCSNCGHKLYAESSRQIRYYRDSARRKGYECPAVYIHADVVEEQVSRLVSRLILPEDWQQRLVQIANGKPDDDETRRKSLNSKLRNLRELFIDGDIKKPEYEQRKAAIESELVGLVKPRPHQVIEAGDWLQGIGDLWSQATPDEQRQIALCLFKAIYVDMDTGRVTRFQVYPDFVPLFRQIEGLVEEGGYFESREIAAHPGRDPGQTRETRSAVT